MKIVEFIVLFLLVPLGLLVDVSLSFKVALVLIGFAYCIGVLIKTKQFNKAMFTRLNMANSWKIILLRLLITIVFTNLIMYFYQSESWFIVLKEKSLMWISIVLFYSVVSVYPQELLYRTFFFYRYKELFKHPILLILVNALIFSFAHIVLKNVLVLLITFIGGLIFASTYHKSKSLLLTSIEHALYGSWLFTVGMGEMLAFPMP